jgi:phage terminase Nu1 subunit (DNA packaging protein)
MAKKTVTKEKTAAANLKERLADVWRVAEEFGCSDRQVQKFVSTGMPKAGHGKYDLLECWKWYALKLKTELEETKQDVSQHSLEWEQTRETKAKADIAELKAAQMRRELIPIDLYRQRVSAHHSVVRQNMLALPGQLASQLEGLARIEIKARMDKKIKDLLNSLATGKEIIHAANGNAAAKATADTDAPRTTGRTKPTSGRGAGRRTRSTSRHNDKRVGGSTPRAKKRNK